MIVCDNNIPYAFVHNPRSSGTSISEYLTNCAGGRMLTNIFELRCRLHSVYAEEVRYRRFDNHFVFGFIRNPFSREYSLYKLFNRRINPNVSFKQWLFEYYDQYSRPQYGFFCDTTGELKVNLYRFEERESSMRAIAQRLNLDAERFISYNSKDSVNFNVEDSYIEAYDNEMIDFVAEKRKVDLEAFGYTFDSYTDVIKNVPFSFDVDTLYYCNEPSPIKCINV